MTSLLSIARYQADYNQQAHSRKFSEESTTQAIIDYSCSICHPLNRNYILSREWNNFWVWITNTCYAQDFSARTVRAFENYINSSREQITFRNQEREKVIL